MASPPLSTNEADQRLTEARARTSSFSTILLGHGEHHDHFVDRFVELSDIRAQTELLADEMKAQLSSTLAHGTPGVTTDEWLTFDPLDDLDVERHYEDLGPQPESEVTTPKRKLKKKSVAKKHSIAHKHATTHRRSASDHGTLQSESRTPLVNNVCAAERVASDDEHATESCTKHGDSDSS